MVALLKPLSNMTFLVGKKWEAFQNRSEAELPNRKWTISQSQGSVFTLSTTVLDKVKERCLTKAVLRCVPASWLRAVV